MIQRADPPRNSENRHGSCVAFGDDAVLILGASGAGKSTLVLALMAVGGVLVADDRADLAATDDGVFVSAPAPLAGLVEALGVGLLRAPHQPSARLALVVDLDQAETARLPQKRNVSILGHAIPLLHNVEGGHFAMAIRLYLTHGPHPEP